MTCSKEFRPAELNSETRSKLEEIIRLVPYIKIKFRQKLFEKIKEKKDVCVLFTRDNIDKLFMEIPTYHIAPGKCRGCSICKSRCPTDAIEGEMKQVHTVNQNECIKCRACHETCPPKFDAIMVKTTAF